MGKPYLIVLFCILLSREAMTQVNCTSPGQTPESAILVCGSETLQMSTAPMCGLRNIPPPCSDGFPYYRDLNPHFFRMACYQPGTLGFTITPVNSFADYSWQLFDITNRNPVDIFTDPALQVACNWSSDPGETGASSQGSALKVCSGAQPLFSSMPGLIQGHTYLLMVCNMTPAPDGYELSFSGGTAKITDPAPPRLLMASPNCTGTEILVRCSKKVMCGSLAPDGSDFVLSAGAQIISARPPACDALGATDSIYLQLDRPLPNGTYSLILQDGTDGNTLKDVCGSLFPAGDMLSINIGALPPPAVNGMQVTGCAPRWIEISFDRPILCASLAPDASDFSITGPQPVTLRVAPSTYTYCAGGLVKLIRLDVTSTWTTAGNYQVDLVTGPDGNVVTDACGLATPPGPVGNFTITSPISAQFTFTMPPGCNATKASFVHDGNGAASSWDWSFGTAGSSTLQNPVIDFPQPGDYNIRLVTSNGICTDTASQTLKIGVALAARFEVPADLCPGDSVRLINRSSGTADQWRWEFGNGSGSTFKDPAGFRYPLLGHDQYYTVKLVATNYSLPCTDSSTKVIRVLGDCTIGVPTAFTPNGDGKNDFFYPLNALKGDQLQFRVYNRFGQLLFSSRGWTDKWDGRVNGILQETGVYAWQLQYIHRDSGEKVYRKGTVVLIR